MGKAVDVIAETFRLRNENHRQHSQVRHYCSKTRVVSTTTGRKYTYDILQTIMLL